MSRPPRENPRAGVVWASTAIAVAALLLLLTNAASPEGWLAQHPPDAVPPVVRDAADGWWRITSAAGLTTPRATVERLWRAAQAATWPGSGAPERQR